MATKFEVVLSAKLDEKSVSDIQKQLDNISKGLKLDIKADTSSVDKMTSSVKDLGNAAGNAKTHTQGLGDIISKFSSWQVVGDVIHGVKNAMEDMVQQVFDLDESLTELDKVTDLTSSGLADLADDAFAVGEQIGATGKDVIDATTLFAQAGYEAKDALDLGEQAIMLKNVSEAGATAEGSANTLIAAMKAFNLDATESTHIVDALNQVSNKYAVSVNDLATAIKKSSASMAAGNNSLEQTFGLVTAGTEILREPGRVANGLSTITARLTQKNDEYIASITGGMGVIDKNTGELRSTFDVLQDLSKAWTHLTSVEKQELAETVAGKTQRSLFTAIMTNFESAVGATEQALNSEGSAAAENEKRMNSLQGKTQQLQSAWQDFARNTIDSEAIKSLLSLGTSILKVANSDIGRFIIVLGSATLAVNLLKKALSVEHLLKFASGFQTLQKATLAAVTGFQVASVSGGTFSAVMTGAGAAVESLTASLLASPLFWLVAGGLAIYGIIEAFNTLIPQMGELEKKTEESTKAYSDAKTEVKGYKDQLEDINKQISDIQSKGKLSITDEKDLKNLQEEKTTLEANLKLAQQSEQAKKGAAQADIVNQINYKSNNPFDFFSQDETEKSIENAKKLLKDAGNSISQQLGNDRENINFETKDMIAAYKALAEEITKQKEKIANSNNMSEKEATAEKEKLNNLQAAYSDLGVHLNENASTLKEWYATLADGGEETEEARNQIEGLLTRLGQTLDIDLVGAAQQDTDAMAQLNEQITNATDAAGRYQEALDNNIEAMVNYGENLDILKTAQEELSNSGAITAETFQSITENGLIEYLQVVDGQMTVNTDAFMNSTEQIKANALANLEATTYEQIRAVVLEDLKSKETDAGNAAAGASGQLDSAGNSAQEMGKKMLDASGDVATLTAQLNELNKSQGGSGQVGEDVTGKVQNILNNANKTKSFIESWKPSSSKTATKKSSGGSKKKSSGSTSKTAKEEYKAEVDALYWYKNALDTAKDSVDKLNDALKNTDNFNEQEKYIRQLIDATNNQINKTNDLKNAQANQINDYINQLRAQGFAINYNASSNELYINNMERLGQLSGDNAKAMEKLINKIQSLNDNNRNLDGSIMDLTADVKDYYQKLADFPEKKLEKFNDLMKEFQQSQLDVIQYQIDDIQHEMDNDPRLKALEEQIEALEKQNDELDNQKELEEKLLAVEEAKIKLQNAQKQRNMMVYRENQGWVKNICPAA